MILRESLWGAWALLTPSPRGRLRPFEAAFVDVNLVIDAVDAVQAVP